LKIHLYISRALWVYVLFLVVTEQLGWISPVTFSFIYMFGMMAILFYLMHKWQFPQFLSNQKTIIVQCLLVLGATFFLFDKQILGYFIYTYKCNAELGAHVYQTGYSPKAIFMQANAHFGCPGCEYYLAKQDVELEFVEVQSWEKPHKAVEISPTFAEPGYYRVYKANAEDPYCEGKQLYDPNTFTKATKQSFCLKPIKLEPDTFKAPLILTSSSGNFSFGFNNETTPKPTVQSIDLWVLKDRITEEVVAQYSNYRFYQGTSRFFMSIPSPWEIDRCVKSYQVHELDSLLKKVFQTDAGN